MLRIQKSLKNFFDFFLVLKKIFDIGSKEWNGKMNPFFKLHLFRCVEMNVKKTIQILEIPLRPKVEIPFPISDMEDLELKLL
jgi:hypothetical protein